MLRRRSSGFLPARRLSRGVAIPSPAPLTLTSIQRALAERPGRGHLTVVGAFGSGKSSTAAARVLWLDAQRERRVLALGGSRDASLVRLLDRATTFHALERRGHRVAGITEWTQHTLEELGVRADSQRVLSFGPLTAFLMHHAHALPLRAFHERLATASSLQLRRTVADMVRFFTTLEAHGIQSDTYTTFAEESTDVHHVELAHAYRVYHELQQRHDVRSWDGLVLDLQRILTSDPHCLDSATREFTDVVMDDVDRWTPAMIDLVSRVIRQPQIQSSLSLSDSDNIHRMTQLQTLLASLDPEQVQLPSDGEASAPATRARAGVRRLAAKVLETSLVSNANETIEIPLVTSLACESFDDEAPSIVTLIQQRLASSPSSRITVFCPSHAEVRAVSQVFLASGMSVNGYEALDTARRLLFDEPGIDTLFSLLVALWSPSDTKHLYNVLRSEFFAFPTSVLSRIMEKQHRRASHATLVDVLTAFVTSKGHELRRVIDDDTLDSALANADQFLQIVHDCRDQCHRKSVAEIVQLFLERTGHLERLVDPQTPRDAREAIALAAFLREIDAAQRIVQSAFVPFVVPYLVQLQAARVVSIAGDGNEDDDGSHVDNTIRVLPLTRYDLDEYEAERDGEDVDLVVLMAMRDAKFPGRLKRITWPLPTSLMAEPLPVQTRHEFLADAERLVYDTLVQLNPKEIVLSYSKFANGGSAKKPEKLSRVLEPLWSITDAQVSTSPLNEKPTHHSSVPSQPSNSPPLSGYEPSHLSYSQIAEYTRCPHQYYLSRVLGLRSFDDDDHDTPNLARMFGSAVHEAIAAFGVAIRNGDAIDMAEHTAFQVLERAWRHDGFLSQRQATFFWERAQSTLRGFVRRHNGAAEIVAVEKTFEVRLGRHNNVLLHGVWDRIDHTTDGIVIREFKTNPSAQRRSNQNAAAAESLQLQIYMVAYEQLHGMAPRGATLEVLEEMDAPNAVGFVPYTPDLRANVDEIVDATYNAIRKGEFQAIPGFFQCAMCPYASSVCHANAMDTGKDDVV